MKNFHLGDLKTYEFSCIFDEKIIIFHDFPENKICNFEKTLKSPKMILTQWIFRCRFVAREARRTIVFFCGAQGAQKMGEG